MTAAAGKPAVDEMSPSIGVTMGAIVVDFLRRCLLPNVSDRRRKTEMTDG